MIQRIQTIFLLLAAGALGALLLLPFATSTMKTAGIFIDGSYSILDSIVLEALTFSGILLLLISIFLFKRRKVQVRIGYLVIFLSLLILIAAYVLLSTQETPIMLKEIQFTIGISMPVVGILCTGIAIYFIRKDERLVQSMDRLR